MVSIDASKEIPVTAERAKAGAYSTMPMYKIIWNENAIEAHSLVALPNLLSKYWEKLN